MGGNPRRTVCLAAAVAVALASLATAAWAQPGTPQSRAEALIEKLAAVPPQDPKLTVQLLAGFVHGERGGKVFGTGIGPQAQPKPIMDLVDLGVDALPALLDHLTDSRPTHLTVLPPAGGFAGFMGGCEYDSRYRAPARRIVLRHILTDQDQGRGPDGSYNLRVGDLCYILLGQIVNRRLRPTNTMDVFSPVDHPELATAARKDWGGLTKAEHLKSLISDAYPESFGRTCALPRLCFYYPKEGESLALRLLGRPIVDDDSAGEAAIRQLQATDEPKKWTAIVASYRREVPGVDPNSLARQIHFEKRIHEGRPESARLLRAFHYLFPKLDPFSMPMVKTMEGYAPCELAEDLAYFHTPRLDAAFLALFRRMAAIRPGAAYDPAVDQFAAVAAERDSDPTRRDVYVRYLRDALAEIKASPRFDESRWRLELIRRALNVVGVQEPEYKTLGEGSRTAAERVFAILASHGIEAEAKSSGAVVAVDVVESRWIEAHKLVEAVPGFRPYDN